MTNKRKDAEKVLANLRKMIEEARRMNEETQDHTSGTRMLTNIIAHETARSRKHHGGPAEHESEKDNCA
jgi:hypothetical protein